MDLIVYFDEDYPNSWIPRAESKKVVKFLIDKGFSECNAKDLSDWMRKAINQDKCHQSIVVFSQDVIPETVCHDSTSNSLIRSYLDCGGTIVWMADIPFYYQGLNQEHSSRIRTELFKGNDIKSKIWTSQPVRPELFEKLINFRENLWMDEDAKFARSWERIAAFRIVGVKSVSVENPSSKTKITRYGKLVGLKNSWYGIRPIIIKGLNIRKRKPVAIATCKPSLMLAREKWVRDYEKGRKVPLTSFLEYVSKLTGLIPAMILALTAAISLLSGFAWVVTLSLAASTLLLLLAYIFYWLLFTRTTHANAWLKRFNPNYPGTGFIRIWDFKIDRVTDTMLQELYQIVSARIEGKTVL
jgi:hypothetical protein